MRPQTDFSATGPTQKAWALTEDLDGGLRSSQCSVSWGPSCLRERTHSATVRFLWLCVCSRNTNALQRNCWRRSANTKVSMKVTSCRTERGFMLRSRLHSQPISVLHHLSDGGSRRYLTALLDGALELYWFGDGDDPFKANLLLFHSIRRKVEVWTLITKEEKERFSRGRSNLFIGCSTLKQTGLEHTAPLQKDIHSRKQGIQDLWVLLLLNCF